MAKGSLHLAFIWFSQNGKGQLTIEHKYVDGVDADLLNEVRVRLNDLGAKWHIACLAEDRLSLICDFPEMLGTYYDAIVNSRNAIMALTTPFEVVIAPFEQSANVQ